MLSSAGIAWIASHLFSFLSGLFGSMFILTVNFIHWLKGNSDLSSCDLIISSSAVCNLVDLCLCFIVGINYISFFLPSFNAFKMRINFWSCLRLCNFWFCIWFCMYCCLKIVRFTHPFLAQLAMRFLANVPWVLLASVFVSLATCLPIIIITEVQIAVHAPYNVSVYKENSSFANGSLKQLQVWEQDGKMSHEYFVSISLLYMIFLCASVTILLTLCSHMKRMGQNANSFTNPHIDAHLGAVKTVSSLLILYSIYYLTQFGRFFMDYLTKSLFVSAACIMLLYFPALNSIILIFGISRLKKTLCGIFSHILHSERGQA